MEAAGVVRRIENPWIVIVRGGGRRNVWVYVLPLFLPWGRRSVLLLDLLDLLLLRRLRGPSDRLRRGIGLANQQTVVRNRSSSGRRCAGWSFGGKEIGDRGGT